MRDLDGLPLPGREMLAAGLIVFGASALALTNSGEPYSSGFIYPWVWTNGSVLVVTALGLGLLLPAWKRQIAFAFFVASLLPLVWHAQFLGGLAAAWVSACEHAMISVAAALLAFPSSRTALATARIVVGVALIWFGLVNWLFHETISGLIQVWMPGRNLVPWIVGVASALAGVAILADRLSPAASALVGVMYLLGVVLVYIPHLIRNPTNLNQWHATGMALALTGVVWTIHRALQSSARRLPGFPSDEIDTERMR